MFMPTWSTGKASAGLAAVAFLIAVTPTPSYSQERTELGPDRATFVFRGFLAGRGKLRSGRWSLSARRASEDGAAQTRGEIEAEKEIVFDFGGLLTRVEHQETHRTFLSAARVNENSWSRKTVATPELVAVRAGKGTHVTIYGPEKATADYWDPRVVGIASVEDFERGTDLQAISDRWRGLLESGAVTAYSIAPGRHVELGDRHGGARHRVAHDLRLRPVARSCAGHVRAKRPRPSGRREVEPAGSPRRDDVEEDRRRLCARQFRGRSEYDVR